VGTENAQNQRARGTCLQKRLNGRGGGDCNQQEKILLGTRWGLFILVPSEEKTFLRRGVNVMGGERRATG